MDRLANWEERLSSFLRDRRRAPFKYGSNDCAMFASDAVIAITGTDPAPDFRGKYRTLAGSVRALRDIGEGDLDRTFSDRFPSKPVAFARRGDLVFNGEAVGVCLGADCAFVGSEENVEGLVTIPTMQMKKAWAVGNV